MNANYSLRFLFLSFFLVVFWDSITADPILAQTLHGSVGQNGVNDPEDVREVQTRLHALGFEWIESTGVADEELSSTIRLFQAITSGSHAVDAKRQDGRIDPKGRTIQWLYAKNAPRWMRLTPKGEGFYNVDINDEPNDKHEFGTDWLDHFVIQVGEELHMHGILLSCNDASLEKGHDTPDHNGHETGLAMDLRLPKKNFDGPAPGGRTHLSKDYDREAARTILKTIRGTKGIDLEGIFFNDPELIKEGLCKQLKGHDNHIHFQIVPPERME